MCYKTHNIFAVIRGTAYFATKTPATVITYKYEGHLPRNNRTAVAYIGTHMLRFVNYAKTSGLKPLVRLIGGGVQGHK